VVQVGVALSSNSSTAEKKKRKRKGAEVSSQHLNVIQFIYNVSGINTRGRQSPVKNYTYKLCPTLF
jgi:hypothetical protein